MGLQIADAVDTLDDVEENIDTEVNREVADVVDAMSVRAAALAPEVDRTLKNSIDAHHANDMGYHVVEATADHAAYVEFGTGRRGNRLPLGGSYPSPRTPPYQQIISWVMHPNTEFEPDISTGMAIAQTIADVGTNPHPYMRPAFLAYRSKLVRAARRGITQAVQRSV